MVSARSLCLIALRAMCAGLEVATSHILGEYLCFVEWHRAVGKCVKTNVNRGRRFESGDNWWWASRL